MALVTIAIAVACGRDRTEPNLSTSGSSVTKAPAHGAQPWFTDRAAEAGLDFTHFNGMAGAMDIAEILPPGAALLDYDGDGAPRAVLVQGQMLGNGKTLPDAVAPPRSGAPPSPPV